jgi:hypothetical protein
MNKNHDATERILIILKDINLSSFFNIIWHLVLHSDSHIYHTFPAKDCIPELYM